MEIREKTKEGKMGSNWERKRIVFEERGWKIKEVERKRERMI